MIHLLEHADSVSEIEEPPEIAPLRSAIDAFAASLTAAHPCIFARAPNCDLEDLAALLHMSLDQSRHLLAVYDSLISANAVWLFDTGRVDDLDDCDGEAPVDDEDDIPF